MSINLNAKEISAIAAGAVIAGGVIYGCLEGLAKLTRRSESKAAEAEKPPAGGSTVEPKEEQQPVTDQPAYDAFEALFAKGHPLVILDEHHNGTGYFNPLVTTPLEGEVGTIYAGVDDTGRKVIVIKKAKSNIVIFQRYDTRPDFYAANFGSEYSRVGFITPLQADAIKGIVEL